MDIITLPTYPQAELRNGKHCTNSLIGKYFPLAAEPKSEDLSELEVPDKVGVRAMAPGEKRKPRKGEWYLSGAIIEAYRAPNDLSSEYYIAKLVVV